mmetsp:Transcript_14151/g.30725  ORF Transcript_14151/g.30725 Transcript_14151/m.30725 type:complete len:219 (+) Transcript_14151:1239-1895(+)
MSLRIDDADAAALWNLMSREHRIWTIVSRRTRITVRHAAAMHAWVQTRSDCLYHPLEGHRHHVVHVDPIRAAGMVGVADVPTCSVVALCQDAQSTLQGNSAVAAGFAQDTGGRIRVEPERPLGLVQERTLGTDRDSSWSGSGFEPRPDVLVAWGLDLSGWQSQRVGGRSRQGGPLPSLAPQGLEGGHEEQGQASIRRPHLCVTEGTIRQQSVNAKLGG